MPRARSAAIAPTGSSAVVAVVPHGRDDGARHAARGEVVADRGVERVGAHGEVRRRAAIARTLSRPKPGEQRRLLDRAVALRRDVDHERRRAPPAARRARASSSVARSRAQSSATSVLVEAVSWMTPLHASDSPTICRIQSHTTSSSSVSAGLDCQRGRATPSPVLRRSPSTPASSAVRGEVAEEARVLPVREAGQDDARRGRRRPRRTASALAGGWRGQRVRASAPGVDVRHAPGESRDDARGSRRSSR